MGSKISSEKKEEAKNKDKEIYQASKGVSIYEGNNNTNSSYHGVKSELSNTSGEAIAKSDVNIKNGNIKQKEFKEEYDELSYKAKTTIYWKEGGNTVYVTGSFSNWKQWFLMNKNPSNDKEFIITLELPKGVYFFKFIVDSNWKCSKDYHIEYDGNGNYNNKLDTTTIKTYVIEPKVKQIE